MTAPKPHVKRQHPPTEIGRLLNKFGISLQDLKDCMEQDVQFSSRSTLHRMVRGELSEDLSAQLRPVAARCLEKFLVKKGLDRTELHNELTAIFNEGEYQPMSFQRVRLNRNELDYFGLPKDPFRDDPASREEVYFPPAYREVFDNAIDAAKWQHFIAVLGPVGSSKSTIQDYIRDHITREKSLRIVWPEFYNQANLTPLEIARSILRALGVEKIPRSATDVAAKVTEVLRSLTLEGNRVAIIVDNCHELQKPAVRSFKKFLEMSSGGFQRYLGIILFGWPEFENTLKSPDFAEIYERLHITRMPEFHPLAVGYMEKRFENIGQDLYKFFDQDAVDYIAQNAETPLQCGNIANRALQHSMHTFDEPKVIGASLRTKMMFDTKTDTPFRKRQ
jgi:type II secretory pathway predicted ATPase ExeA